MTIDYDQLRQVLNKRVHGDDRAACDADFWLYKHKVAIAEELLALRDGIADLITQKELLAAKLCDPTTDVLNPDWLLEVGGEEPIGMALQKVCDQLTDLLKGHEA